MPELDRETILATTPGQELDALVAGNVFQRRARLLDGRLYFVGPGLQPEVPHYSTDIAAAWEAAGMLCRQGYRLHHEWRPTGHFAYFDPPIGIGERGKGETAPEAICKAALLAVVLHPERPEAAQ